MIRSEKKRDWNHFFWYGISLGLLMLAMQYAQYRFLVVRNAEKWYIGVIALLFTLIGIWAGKQYKPKRNILRKTQPQPCTNNRTEIVQTLCITPRELEVLELMSVGLSNQQIADKLFVSLNTVKTHSSNLFAKMDVQRRTQAIQRAFELGMIHLVNPLPQKHDFIEKQSNHPKV